MLSIYSDLFSKRKGGKSLRQLTHHESGKAVLVEVLDAVQRVVDALTTPEGGRYVVSLSDQGAASGNLTTKRIVITYKPLTDRALNLAQVTEVMTGLTTHEIGHTVISPLTAKVLDERFSDASGQDPLAKFFANVADDHKLEVYMTARFPGIGGSFRPTAEWVTRQYGISGKLFKMSADLDLVGRTNLAIAAFRYPFAVRWVRNALTRREREWWQDWASRYAVTQTEDEIEALLREGLTRLGAPDLSDPEPQPEDEEPGDEPGESEDEGEGGEGNEPDDTTGEGNDEERESDPSRGRIPDESKPGKSKPSESDDDEVDEAEESALDKIGKSDDDADDESDEDEGEGDDEDDDEDWPDDDDEGYDGDAGDPGEGRPENDDTDEDEDDESATDEDGDDLDEEPDDDSEADEQDAREGRGGEDKDEEQVDLSDNPDTSDEDEAGLTTGQDGSDQGESGDADSTGSDPDAEGEREHESETFDSPSEGSMDEDAEGGQGEQAARSENATEMADPWRKEPLDEDALLKGLDDLLQPDDYRDQWAKRGLQQVLDEERTVEKIKSRDGFGTMKVHLDL